MFVDWVGTIKFLSPKDPGAFVIRRLTKVEYGNTLQDLFGVDAAVAAELRMKLKAVLVSPHFLFITPEKEPEAGLKIAPLDDYQLASRLSNLLWMMMPDAELYALADAGKLHEQSVPQSQKRLQQDGRSQYHQEHLIRCRDQRFRRRTAVMSTSVF